MSERSAWPPPPNPLPRGEGEPRTYLTYSPSPCGRGWGEGTSPRDRANAEQRQASNPAVSAFVGASAGSGKTKLLTDRLLRLMLAGAAPERIQCLTFTKAAAAEMAVRLQRTLGKWVTLDDTSLAGELRALAVEPSDAMLSAARALFARVLDLPGGMRIGTIHAFCQSLLRRFPLEASLSPHFRLVDDRDAEDALTEARENMLARASTAQMRTALETLAGLASADQFGRHVATLQGDLPRLQDALELGDDLEGAQRRALGVTAATEAEVIALAVNWQAEPSLREAARIVQRLGSQAVRRARGAYPGVARTGSRRSGASTGRIGARSSSPRRGSLARPASSPPRRCATPIPAWSGISSMNATGSSRRSTPARRCASPRCRPR